jgi:hypothetical protein
MDADSQVFVHPKTPSPKFTPRAGIYIAKPAHHLLDSVIELEEISYETVKNLKDSENPG